MPAQRSSPAWLDATALMLGALAACSRGPANFPDRAAVAAAQAEWCEALAKLQGAEKTWPHLAACKAGYTTASPAYLRPMTKCFSRRTEAAGDEATDRSQIIAECNNEVAAGMTEDEAAAREVGEARCARMDRCEHVPVAECKAAFAKLETAQRVAFTTFYNAAGRFEIVDCLDSASCTDNEEAGREACYKPVSEKLLWFPE